MSFKLLILFVMALLAGCQSFAEHNAQPIQRGWVEFTDDGTLYRPCHFSDSSKVVSFPSALERLYYGRKQKSSLYVEWFGDTAFDRNEVAMSQIHFVSSRPDSCSEMFSDNLMTLMGDNQRWNAQLRENYILLFHRDTRRTLKFDYDQSVRFGRTWVWNSKIDLPSGDIYRLELSVEPQNFCRIDDNWYTFSSTLTLNGAEFTGCARRGMLDKSLLNTHYQFPFYISTRSFDLYLKPDGSAFLKEDYQNLQPVVESFGSWSLMPDRRLMIQFAYNQDMLRQEVLVFAIKNDGILSMEKGHSRYGPLGIKLVPVGHTMTLDSKTFKKIPR